jgi:hypothetical protein
MEALEPKLELVAEMERRVERQTAVVQADSLLKKCDTSLLVLSLMPRILFANAMDETEHRIVLLAHLPQSAVFRV